MAALVSSVNIELVRKAYSTHAVAGDFLPCVYVVEPTSRCNINCIMCPNSALPDVLLGDMALDRAAEIFEAISPTAELVMLYFMGEPLLHPSFREYLQLARKFLKGTLVLSTNATLLNDRAISAIVDAKIDLVLCCIDRWSKEAYEQVRRGAKFDTVVDNTKRLLEARGVGSFPQVIVKALDINHMEENERIEFSDYWSQRGGIPLVGWLNTWAGQRSNLLKLTTLTAPYEAQKRSPCADLWFKMVINWRSEVVLCCHNFDSSIPLGSLRSGESVAKTWHGEQIRQLRQEHANGRYGINALCRGCREWGELGELDAYLTLDRESLHLVF